MLFDSAPDPIIIVDKTGIILLANKEAERKFEYETASLINKSVEILMPERFHQIHTKYREHYNQAPRVRPMGSGSDLYARKRDGTEFPVEISLSPLRHEDTLLIVSIIRDITERKENEKSLKAKAEELEKANTELTRSNLELEQFAYIASHDLQEPLRSIAGSCQLLERKFASYLPAEAREFIDYAVDGAKRMQELINDLLTYSRVTSKPKEKNPVNCQKIVSQILSTLRTIIEENHAKIHFDSLPNITGDQSQISQLFLNLLTNALKFRGHQDPDIAIKASRDGDFWKFSITDNGIGIDSRYFDRIFVIFKRLHTRDKYPGTGIGLAACKRIVERHGGAIWLQSTIGKGTTFYFTLPALESHTDC